MTKSPRRLKQQVQDTVGEQVRDLPLNAVRLAMFGVGRALLLSDRVTKDYKEMRESGVGPVLGRLRDDAQHTAGKVAGRVATIVRGEDERSARTTTASSVAAPPRPAPRNAATTSTNSTTSTRAGTQAAAKASGKASGKATAGSGEREIAIGKPAKEPVARPAPEPTAESGPRRAPAPSPKPAGRAEPVPRPQPETRRETPQARRESQPDTRRESQPETRRESRAEGDETKGADLPVPDYDEATLPQLRARLRGLTADQVKLLREYERRHAARAEVLRMYENRIAKLNGGSHGG
ncbi:hypothetical protein [Thermomonospora umbrina]|uniref:DUF8129 domain-containing protein n=1 Tax=Thermomonospora umbrina TaxID=111806 RepID=A0A3D9SWQ4_9ACTN|nr:hypothetical protein [Thermomonospora umbrina]REE96061.1 hypothetical protein DFJ69_1483 [Thermomonospora umbrina]